MTELLRLLEDNGKLTPQQIGAMLGRDAANVEEEIAKCEEDKVILGYTALVDWDRASEELVTALIEVKISPQRGDGFDRIAERIYQYDEVESLYLMSGSFDLAVMIRGRTMKEISHFVFARLAPIEGVTSTSTHFIMKKYKEKNHTFVTMPEQEERLLFV